MTSSGGKQHFIVKEAEGITQQPALRTAARGDQRIVVVAAKIGVIRHRHIMVVIDISGRVPGRHPPGGRIGMHLRRIAEVHLMRNRAGIEIAAYPPMPLIASIMRLVSRRPTVASPFLFRSFGAL